MNNEMLRGWWLAAALAFGPFPLSGQIPSGAPAREVEMTAKKYEFSPATVEVAPGTLVRFKITALDRDHGFEIEEVKGSCVKIKKGETATVEYKAEKPGTVEFRCCVRCGLGHGRMKGKVIVKE
ncbi:MAG: hypothetical protein DMG07_05965 [Acidobacteria bacterium]|nr:MAG: hypothetical protein DMG07_05965 [Acidobacteriota bacterium]